MADEGKLRKQADRGQQAERLLKNRILNECFDKIEKALYEAWSISDFADDKGRQNAYMMQRALKSLKGEIAHIARTGQGARAELLKMNDQREKKD